MICLLVHTTRWPLEMPQIFKGGCKTMSYQTGIYHGAMRVRKDLCGVLPSNPFTITAPVVLALLDIGIMV